MASLLVRARTALLGPAARRFHASPAALAGKGIKKQPKKVKEEGGRRKGNKRIMMVLNAAVPDDLPELTDEELARDHEVGNTFNREMQKLHNARNARLAMQLRLKWAAVDALPKKLRSEALNLEWSSMPPLHTSLQPPTWTPPIPGFGIDEDDEEEWEFSDDEQSPAFDDGKQR